jgi:hypothetical protein
VLPLLVVLLAAIRQGVANSEEHPPVTRSIHLPQRTDDVRDQSVGYVAQGAAAKDVTNTPSSWSLEESYATGGFEQLRAQCAHPVSCKRRMSSIVPIWCLRYCTATGTAPLLHVQLA